MKEGWELKKLGEVCEVRGGATPLRSNELFWENGDIPWFTIDDIRDQGRIISSTKQKVTAFALKKLTLYPKNTVLLCCTASVGEYAITTIPLTSNQQFNGLTIKNINEIFPFFLFYYCSTLKEKLLSLSGKTTIDFVSSAKIKDLDIFLPPLSEQQHIVEILDTAFAKIDSVKQNAERNLQNAKELFQSVLDFELLKKDYIYTAKLGDVAEYIKEQGKYFLPYVGMEHIISKTSKFIGEEKNIKVLSNTFKFRKGDVLYGRLRPYLQKVWLAKFDGHCSTELFPIRPSEKLDSSFLKYWLLSDRITEKINNTCTGARMPRANMNTVLLFSIPLPSISEQQQIVSKLDALSAKCKELENNYLKTINDCDELKKAILAKAFNGEL